MNNRLMDCRPAVIVPCLMAGCLLLGANASSGRSPSDSKRTNYGMQAWQTSSTFPEDFVTKYWDDDYRITSVAHGDGLWAVVMSQNSGIGSQHWKTSAEFPDAFIKERWDDGHAITSVAYGDGLWAVVMSEGNGYTRQSWRTYATFPEDFVKKHWDDGYHITSVGYGGGLWAIVMSQNSGYSLQSWKTSNQYPIDFLKEQWDQGYDVTSVAHGDGLWAVVTSKLLRDDPTPRGSLGVTVVDAENGGKGALVEDIDAGSPAAKAGIQKNDVIVAVDGATIANWTELLNRIKAFPPGQPIKIRLLREGKAQDLQVELGGRTVTVEKCYGSQFSSTNAQFPQEFVNDYWGVGHYITSVSYGGGAWAVVMSKEDLPALRELPKLPPAFFPEVEP